MGAFLVSGKCERNGNEAAPATINAKVKSETKKVSVIFKIIKKLSMPPSIAQNRVVTYKAYIRVPISFH